MGAHTSEYAGPIRGRHIAPSARETLRRLVAEHPGATDGQVRLMLRARAGLTVSKSTVRRARLALYTVDPKHLTSGHRRVLMMLLATAGPEGRRSEVRRKFAERTGRPISANAVSRFAIDVMGYPAKPAGPRRRP